MFALKTSHLRPQARETLELRRDTEVESDDSTQDLLRQQMYARIAQGQALAEVEDQARNRWRSR